MTAEVTSLYFLQKSLDGLIARGVPDAAAYKTALEGYVNNNPSRFAPIRYPDGSYYGLKIASGVVSPAPNPSFPMTPTLCAQSVLISGGATPQNIETCTAYFEGLTADAREIATINSNQLSATGSDFILLLLVGLFGVLNWDDAFLAGSFAPNAFLKAQAFVTAATLTVLPPAVLARFPPNTGTILTSILTSNEALFFANVVPELGRNANVFPNSGVFAVRIDCASQSDKKVVNEICVKNLRSFGKKALTFADIPQGNRYVGVVTPKPYFGNDNWGVEFATGTNISVELLSCDVFYSANGSNFGYHLPTSITNSVLNGFAMSNFQAGGINYAVLIENIDASNTVANGKAWNFVGNNQFVEVPSGTQVCNVCTR